MRNLLLAIPTLMLPHLAAAQTAVTDLNADALLRADTQLQQKIVQELDIIRQQLALLIQVEQSRQGASSPRTVP